MIKQSNGRDKNRNKKKWKIAAGVLLGIVLLLGIISYAYVSDYYHADETAKEAITELSDQYTVRIGEHKELIFTPSSLSDCTTALIFYPGGKVEYTAYAPLMCKLAERGIFCILVHMPCNLAILDTDAADDYRYEYPDIENWYIGGHSLGGASASLYLEKHYAEYKGLILMGAYSSLDLSMTDLKVIEIYGENDGVMNRDKYQKYLVNLPADYEEFIIPGGCHSYFGNYGMQEGDGAAEISSDEQQTLTAEVLIDFVQ